MMRMANSMLYYNKIVSVDDYLKKIDSINSDDLLKVANETLDDSHLVKVILKSVKE
jgi:predicted Zn-dependent peptidase